MIDQIIKIIEIIVWPFTVCFGILIFKNDIHTIIQRISTIKYKDLEATLSNSIKDAEKISKNIKIKKISDNTQNLELESRLLRILDISPKAAILEAWAEIEAEAFKKDLVSGTTFKRVLPVKILEYVGKHSKLSAQELELLNDLRVVRNRASHLPDIIIKLGDAEKYINVAIKVITLLKQK